MRRDWKGPDGFVGIHRDDTDADRKWAEKVTSLRLWPNDSGKPWDVSAATGGLQILCVSQFTLYGVLKGTAQIFHGYASRAGKRVLQKFLAHVGKTLEGKEARMAESPEDGFDPSRRVQSGILAPKWTYRQ